MANIKISNLPVAVSVAGSDSFPVVQSGVTKQATKSVLLTDLGTPASLVLTNATGLPIDAGTINTLPVARGGTGVTSSTGSGNVVLSTSPTLVTPNLGTPSAATLTNATGLPIDAGTTGTLSVARGGTGITSFGTGVATALGQNVTGSGGIVLATSPTLTGTTTLAALTASGNISFDGGSFVFNESGANKDARFEGDTDANLLFLDASTDRVGIGTATPAAKLDVSGSVNAVQARFGSVAERGLEIGTSTISGTNDAGSVLNAKGATSGTLIFQTDSTERMRLDPSGNLFCQGVYNNTSGSAANVFVASNGLLQRSTSSLRYKTDVQDATHGLAEVMQLRPVTYKGKNDGDKVFGGLIAEEVHAVGLTEFVSYNDANEPDALHYGNMVALLTKAIQEQQALITDLRARVAALEAK